MGGTHDDCTVGGNSWWGVWIPFSPFYDSFTMTLTHFRSQFQIPTFISPTFNNKLCIKCPRYS